MADPLSIAASVLTLVTAAGKTAQGLQKAWELRRRNEEFIGLLSELTGLRTQLHVVGVSLERFAHREHPESMEQCYHDVSCLRDQAVVILTDIDRLVDEITRKKDRTIQKYPADAKLSKRKWYRHKSTLLRSTTSKLSPIVTSLTAIANGITLNSIATSLNIERVELISGEGTVIQNAPSTPASQLDNWLHKAIELDATPIKDTNPEFVEELEATSLQAMQSITKPTQGLSRRSSIDSFHSALSSSSDSASSFIAITGSLTCTPCEPLCPCQCHSNMWAYRMPGWMKHIVGSMNIHGNGSVSLGRRPCDKACQRSGPTSLRVSYLAPAWVYLKSLNFYMKAQDLYASRFQFHLPRIIPSTAPVWSIIELGKLPELQDMLKEKIVSLHDVTSSGRSLLNYAAVKGQVGIYEFLVNLGADPYFRDSSGIASNQPGVDRALTGTGLDRIVSKTAKAASYNLFINSETLDQQDFDFLHLVVLGIRDVALDLVLKKYLSPRSDIDVQDVNGRTPLIWAAWRGDIANVNLLLSSRANPDRLDNEGYTAIARAAKAGHLDCIQALLKAGASVQAANGDGYQPLHHASGNKANGLPIVDELLAHGADVRAVCFRGTPLHLAANRGSSATIKRLLHAGADIDAQDSDGDTPAMIALLCWNEPAFVTLMHAGAKLNIVRNSGQNILHLVTWAGSSSLWDAIAERAQTDQLAGVDAGALHKGHELQHCFENCRKLWFVGKRETMDIEEQRFNRMLDAFIR